MEPESRVIPFLVVAGGFYNIAETLPQLGAEVRVERRRSTRFRLRCEVTCTWGHGAGFFATTKGLAHDISAGGIFVNSDERPPAGVLVTLEICLPALEPRRQKLQLHGTGQVVRSSENSACRGFAIANQLAWTLFRHKNQVATTAV